MLFKHLNKIVQKIQLQIKQWKLYVPIMGLKFYIEKQILKINLLNF